MLALYLCLA